MYIYLMLFMFLGAAIVCFKQLRGPNPDRVIATMAIAVVVGIGLAVIHDSGGIEQAAYEFYLGWTEVDRR
jgi:hypothetical protein